MRWHSYRKRTSLFLLALASLAWLSCSTKSNNYKAGEKAELAGRLDEAVNYYSRALSEDPGNNVYRQSLHRAKIRASEFHAMRGTQLKAAGDLQTAREELELAYTLNPQATHLVEALQEIEVAIQ